MGVDCRKCVSFNVECDPAEDSYELPCPYFKEPDPEIINGDGEGV